MAVRAGKMDLLGESKDICHLVDTVEWNYWCAGCQPRHQSEGREHI